MQPGCRRLSLQSRIQLQLLVADVVVFTVMNRRRRRRRRRLVVHARRLCVCDAVFSLNIFIIIVVVVVIVSCTLPYGVPANRPANVLLGGKRVVCRGQ